MNPPSLRYPNSVRWLPASGLWLLSAGLCLLAGCTAVGPDYRKPETAAASAFKNDVAAEKSSTAPSAGWWQVFGDPQLTALETAALAHSPQLASAVARIDEARARLGLARADAQPALSTNATAKLAGESAGRTLPVPPRPLTYRERGDSYRVPFDAAYEIDLWGRVRRSIEAAGAQAGASEQDLAFVRLALTADVAQAWFSLRSLETEVALLTRTLSLRRDQVALSQSRFDAGLTSELDVARARLELANVESEFAELHRRREQASNALAVLTGRAPADFTTPQPDVTVVSAPPVVPPGLPSALLQRRPDVLAAERQLAARTAEIGMAKAAFFPTIRLTGSAGFESADLGSLLGRPSQFWQLGPSLSYPIFDGGRTKANLAAAEARARAALADYQQRVLVAFREVEDALVDLRQQSEQADALNRAATAARTGAELSAMRYDRGLVTYFEVIDAQRSQLGVERSLTQLNGARQISTVRLIKALGGSWSGE